jgi:translation initiation factor 2B subunit (eIF-2B alpha/beta/delta family)
MKKIILVLALAISSISYAKSSAPILDLEKLNRCSDYQVANLENSLVGTYKAKDHVVEIDNTGIQKLSNWEEIIPHGKKRYFSEQELNDQGYCLNQSVEEKDNSIIVTVKISRSVNNIFVNSKQINKFIVVFSQDRLPTYTEKHAAFGRAVIIPAYKGSTTGKLTLEKISLRN